MKTIKDNLAVYGAIPVALIDIYLFTNHFNIWIVKTVACVSIGIYYQRKIIKNLLKGVK